MLSNVTDKMSGEFIACLPAGKSYMLNVNKEQYLFYSENFECRNENNKQQGFQLSIELNKPAIGETVVLKNIFFDVNKYELKSESFTELNKLIDLLNKNAKFRIEIGGHTDNTGDKGSNIILSENRAKSVYDYLIKNGIQASRLAFKGYGDYIPIDSNETEEGRFKNRRTDFKLIAL